MAVEIQIITPLKQVIVQRYGCSDWQTDRERGDLLVFDFVVGDETNLKADYDVAA